MRSTTFAFRPAALEMCNLHRTLCMHCKSPRPRVSDPASHSDVNYSPAPPPLMSPARRLPPESSGRCAPAASGVGGPQTGISSSAWRSCAESRDPGDWCRPAAGTGHPQMSAHRHSERLETVAGKESAYRDHVSVWTAPPISV